MAQTLQKHPLIAQIFKHSSLDYPYNERELIYQAFTKKVDDTFYIVLKSDPRLFYQLSSMKHNSGTAANNGNLNIGNIVNAAQSKFSQQNKHSKVFFKSGEKVWSQDANQKVQCQCGFIIRPRHHGS